MNSQRRFDVRRLDYSRRPWRIVDTESGREVVAECEPLGHPDLGEVTIPVAGYGTRREAVEALGRLAAQLDGVARELRSRLDVKTEEVVVLRRALFSGEGSRRLGVWEANDG